MLAVLIMIGGVIGAIAITILVIRQYNKYSYPRMTVRRDHDGLWHAYWYSEFSCRHGHGLTREDALADLEAKLNAHREES